MSEAQLMSALLSIIAVSNRRARRQRRVSDNPRLPLPLNSLPVWQFRRKGPLPMRQIECGL